MNSLYSEEHLARLKEELRENLAKQGTPASKITDKSLSEFSSNGVVCSRQGLIFFERILEKFKRKEIEEKPLLTESSPLLVIDSNQVLISEVDSSRNIYSTSNFNLNKFFTRKNMFVSGTVLAGISTVGLLFVNYNSISKESLAFFSAYSNYTLSQNSGKQVISSASPKVVPPVSNSTLSNDDLLSNENVTNLGKSQSLEEKLVSNASLEQKKLPLVYSGKLDYDGKGNLDYLIRIEISDLGDATIYYTNGSNKKISSKNLDNFLISSVLEKSYMKALGRVDLISDKKVSQVILKNPQYLEDLRDVMIKRGIYTQDKKDNNGKVIEDGSYKILDPNFKRINSKFKGLNEN